jgi:hypothetical protein
MVRRADVWLGGCGGSGVDGEWELGQDVGAGVEAWCDVQEA